MTTPVIIAAFVTLFIVMAALGGWTHHNRRRQATTKTPHLKPWEVDNWLIQHISHLIKRTERVADKLNRVIEGQKKDMSTKEEILAKVTAVHGMAESIKTVTDELNGEFATISEQIDDLKRQIAEGQTVDLTELEAEVDKVAGVVAGIGAAVKANP